MVPKFAKACLALFVVALASLSLVSSKKKKASEVSDHPGRTAFSSFPSRRKMIKENKDCLF